MMTAMRYLFLLPLALATCACSRPHEPVEEARPSSPPMEAPPAKADPRPVIAVFGDSISAGYGLEAGQSFPDGMQRHLDAEHLAWHVVNLGISGDTTEQGVARIDSATSLHPAIVILELGGNDGLRGMPVASTRANLDQMIVAFQNAGAKVVLAGMTLPPNYGPDYIRDFQKIYQDLGAKYHLTLIPFLMADLVTKDLRYIQPDGIHPTAQGSEIIAGTVLRAIHPLLAANARK
jgi:acyl-CoA thioesterase-1